MNRAGDSAFSLIAALALAVGVVARLVVPLPHGLWEDEIIAATHALQPAWAVVVDSLRNDVHPPLYFLQLHVWSLASHRDGWLIANSVFWGLAAVGSLWWTLRRDGRDFAPLAAAFLAVAPAGLWMSQELRPYAWLSVLLIWAFHFARRVFREDAQRSDWWTLLGLCLAIIYTHAISFIGVVSLGSYSLLLLAEQHAPRRRFVQAIVLFGIAGLATLPVLVNSLMHDANLGLEATLPEFLSWCSQAMTGDLQGQAAIIAGAIAYFALAAAGLVNRGTRLATACFIVLPIALAIGLGLAGKMVFKANIFSTLIAPFAAIVAAQLCLRLRWPARAGVTGAILAASAALAFSGGLDRHAVTGYADAARLIRSQALPGDVVWAPQDSYFKGMAWYLDKPDWGSPLAISAPPSPQWRSAYRRLGPTLVARLHLMPTGQSIAAPGGLTIVTGPSYTPAKNVNRVWLITHPRADLPAGFPPEAIGALGRRGEQTIFALTLTRYESASKGQ